MSATNGGELIAFPRPHGEGAPPGEPSSDLVDVGAETSAQASPPHTRDGSDVGEGQPAAQGGPDRQTAAQLGVELGTDVPCPLCHAVGTGHLAGCKVASGEVVCLVVVMQPRLDIEAIAGAVVALITQRSLEVGPRAALETPRIITPRRV